MTITLEQAKAHLRVLHDDEDTYITGLIAAAKAWTEKYIAQPIEASEVTDQFLEFGDYLQLTSSPFVDVTEIAYVNANGEAATMDVATVRPQDGRIYPPTVGWPSITTYSTITVTYNAGFATTPDDIDHGMLLLIGHWYENREAVNIGNTVNEVPLAVEALIGPYRTPTLA